MSKKRAEQRLAGAALLFAALGDPTRLALIERLSQDGPASISALAERFSMTRQGVTKHLQVLADAGIAEGSRTGREHVWSLNATQLTECRRCLDAINRGWDQALGRLREHLEK